MSDLLYVKAGPRGQASASHSVALAFIEELRAGKSAFDVDMLDLFEADLPEFAAPAAKAKYAVMSGKQPADAAEAAWKEILAVAERLTSAGALVISSPMWNFSIPYKLKQFIDIVVQPGVTFSFSPETGYAGLVTDRPALVVVARGGEYGSGPAKAMDMQLPYIKQVLGFIGFSAIHEIVIEPTLHGGPEVAAEKLQQAVDKAKALAGGFF